jgi:hypothetical protein
LIAAALSSLAATAAHAQQGQTAPGSMYGGITFSQIQYEESGRGTAKPTALGVKIGKVVNENLALEGRLGTGISDDDVSGGPVDVSPDLLLGAYAKGILPLSPRIGVYGLVGVTYGDLSSGPGGLRFSNSDADFSYGFGADFLIGASTSLNIEWARLFQVSGYKLDALTFGVNLRF